MPADANYPGVLKGVPSFSLEEAFRAYLICFLLQVLPGTKARSGQLKRCGQNVSCAVMFGKSNSGASTANFIIEPLQSQLHFDLSTAV